MTQSESSDTKAKGLSLLGLWVLKNNWNETINRSPASWNAYMGAVCSNDKVDF
jgi:hypothetical protein